MNVAWMVWKEAIKWYHVHIPRPCSHGYVIRKGVGGPIPFFVTSVILTLYSTRECQKPVGNLFPSTPLPLPLSPSSPLPLWSPDVRLSCHHRLPRPSLYNWNCANLELKPPSHERRKTPPQPKPPNSNKLSPRSPNKTRFSWMSNEKVCKYVKKEYSERWAIYLLFTYVTAVCVYLSLLGTKFMSKFKNNGPVCLSQRFG